MKKGVGGKEEGLGRNVKLDLSLSFFLSLFSISLSILREPEFKRFSPIALTEIFSEDSIILANKAHRTARFAILSIH